MTTVAATQPLTARAFLFADTDLVQAMTTSGSRTPYDGSLAASGR